MQVDSINLSSSPARTPAPQGPSAFAPHSAACKTATGCATCPLRAACAPEDLASNELEQLDSAFLTMRSVRRGETLFRARDPFQSLYAVRTGSFKTVVMQRDGRAQVTGFHIPGEPLGLDGIGAREHKDEAIAMEDSTVCILPLDRLESMCQGSRIVQRHLFQLMSDEIVRELRLLTMLGTMTAEQRLASFLLDFAARQRSRGYSGTQFNLKMGREEIGSFLGIALETVSRMFARFHRDGLVESSGKQVSILDPEGLSRI